MGLESRLTPLNKKLDKKMFYDFADIKQKEKNVISKFVERLELSYLLTPSTINIQPMINEEYHYEGVMFVTASLKEETLDKHVNVLEEVIHGALPHPVVITFTWQDQILISTCIKRLNKVNRAAVVLETIHRTNWIDDQITDSVKTAFLQSFQLVNLNFANFYEFYKDMDLTVEAFENAKTVGDFTIVKSDEEREQQLLLIQHIQEKELAISRLIAAIKKETQFNKKVEMNIKVQQLTMDIEQLKNNF
ncbi:hypothetical protein CD31_15740 [Lysinibacillus boronitolerans JCM 21713 = 10a = NBRC 103108]|uniref:DUF4391 domain-containing protein n=2 Tax=Lysinibacillus boronitolerans TaxID=309788 RepID=A0ABR4XYN8_9BACI|nr:hypothetical protein CD31_15740 [Lysinibacillus boronitolerans JCM 21713 = 10a = NBRC 103108]